MLLSFHYTSVHHRDSYRSRCHFRITLRLYVLLPHPDPTQLIGHMFDPLHSRPHRYHLYIYDVHTPTIPTVPNVSSPPTLTVHSFFVDPDMSLTPSLLLLPALSPISRSPHRHPTPSPVLLSQPSPPPPPRPPPTHSLHIARRGIFSRIPRLHSRLRLLYLLQRLIRVVGRECKHFILGIGPLAVGWAGIGYVSQDVAVRDYCGGVSVLLIIGRSRDNITMRRVDGPMLSLARLPVSP